MARFLPHLVASQITFQSYCPAPVWRTTICASRRSRGLIYGYVDLGDEMKVTR